MELEKDVLQLTTDQKKAYGRITTPRELEKTFSSANNRPEARHMGKDYHAQGAGKTFSAANNPPEEGIWGRITTPRELEKDFLQLTTDQKKAYGEGLPRPGRPGSWKKNFFS